MNGHANGTHAAGRRGPRTIAFLGPQGSGKTALLESLLFVTGAITRKGSAQAQNTVGDASPEARNALMSVEVNTAITRFMDESFTFLDCPGSVEFLGDTLNALQGADAAVIVAEPDAAKAAMLQPVLKRVADLGIPHMIFINKIDKAQGLIRDLLSAFQASSAKPLVLRQVPIWADGTVTGYVDLAHERAYVYRENAPSEIIPMPKHVQPREQEARFQMLEKLADYDDHLMEELLSDITPPKDEIFADLRRELAEGLIVPVLIGSAAKDYGVRRLLKSFRHDVPGVEALAARLGVKAGEEAVIQVLKTMHGAAGKQSLVRVLRGTVKDGATLYRSDGREERVGGIVQLHGDKQTKVVHAGAGETVALGRLEHVVTGDTLATAKGQAALTRAAGLKPVYRLSIRTADRKDDVKVSAAMAKLHEEDPSIIYESRADTHEFVLAGQGEMHLRTAIAKLARKYQLALETRVPLVGYKETIRKSATERGRHKKQTGGHGQFGDVVLEIKPLPRGEGFVFEDRITGGVVPRNFIPSVEKGVRDYLQRGPLGFPVVDVHVALTDGSYHSVDSSDAAFQQAARIGMTDGMAKCSPVLLEPIMAVAIHTPSDATARINQIVTGHRGQILGFDGRAGWPGWDTVSAHIPEAELQTMIVELRSATQGAATFTATLDHLSELTGKLADHVLSHGPHAA
ncbi:MAG TPA: elongation factor G [Alphaproteobacteria bacterium]|nr:elongation factor G [Alphaproteobacteria bacterium]HAJ47272.1 elongation factor G [Alphaproteobacteria bacterium]